MKNPKSKIQNSKLNKDESNIQNPTSSMEVNPKSNIQNPTLNKDKSNIQNSKSKIQHSTSLIKSDILEYLRQHEQKELLRFITCGSVDDGKSTLIGRLLYETKMVFEDHLMALKAEAKYKRTEDEIDFSLLVDGLQAEREQGITIDVAYRYFSTEKRKFIIADTPGHEQYTRNMATGASNVELAVILIDARNGVLTQTRRHSFIVTLMGIKNIVVAINKMDLVDYSEDVYNKIVNDYKIMFEQLRYSLPYKNFNAELYFIPISALKGDNVAKKSQKMPWYNGKILLEYLNTVKVNSVSESENHPTHPPTRPFRFPVQYINRPHLDFRGYCGTIASGEIKQGDEIIVYPSKKTSKIKYIIPPAYQEAQSSTFKVQDLQTQSTNNQPTSTNQQLTELNLMTNTQHPTPNTQHPKFISKMAITLTLEDELDISRGDLIVKKGEKEPRFNDSFEAFIVWMDEEPLKNREYILKIYTKETNVIVSKILFKKDVNTWEKIEANTLELNDIARVQIDLTERIAFDLYEENKTTGAFILIDKITNFTSAAGIIVGEATKRKKKRIYTEAEIALNKFIREHFPEWGCKAIEEIE
ncbi:sulfate adenylyltransferase subunit 1 [Deferribacter abyssi]|uniref:sulfate adenylyltransferase subunit 1 n=1 Tax=Deferribacter abyssi TaxID=213806 RepID=UPI003C1B90E8